MLNLISNNTTDIFIVIKMQEVLNKEEKHVWFCADFSTHAFHTKFEICHVLIAIEVFGNKSHVNG
jgi:hypothetical protein